MKIIIYSTIALIFLSGCGLISDIILEKKSEKLNGESIEITNLKEASKNDKIIEVTANAPSPYINSYGYYACIEAKAKYLNLKYGQLSLGYSYRFLFDIYKFDPPVYSNIEKVNKNNLQLMYSLPFFSINKSRFKEIDMEKINKSQIAYYTIFKTNQIKNLNFRIGYEQVYSETNSYSYTKFLTNEYENVHFNKSNIKEIDALVLQNIKMIKLGLSIQNIINTSFKAIDKNNEQYRGRYSTTTDFYFDVHLLLFSNVSNVKYRYTIYDSGPNFGLNVTENVDISKYINKKTSGYSFGIEQSKHGLKHANFCNNMKFEFGINPGYYDSNLKGFYLKFSMTGLGIGKM